MNRAEQLAELPTQTSMAWSARPVWDRRPALGDRADRRSNLAVARRDRTRRRHARRSRDRAAALARPESLVTAASTREGGTHEYR
jgi:hypothetical protein